MQSELDGNATPLQLAFRQREDLAHELVEVERGPIASISLHHRPDAADEIAGPIGRVANLRERSVHFVEIRRRAAHPARSCVDVGDDAGQGLIHLVRDRGREHVNRHQPRFPLTTFRHDGTGESRIEKGGFRKQDSEHERRGN